MEFEDIDTNTQRAKVFGGWIVKTYEPVMHDTGNGMHDGWDWRIATCFVPDPNYEWVLDK